MKITQNYLKKLVKEELKRALSEDENSTKVNLYHLLSSLAKTNPDLAVKILKDPRAEGKLGEEFLLIPTDSTKSVFNLVSSQDQSDVLAQIKSSDLGKEINIY